MNLNVKTELKSNIHSHIRALQEGDLIFQSADLTVGFTKMQLLDNHKYALKRQANFF